MSFTKLQQIPTVKWDMLAQKKIFFGHQSVGYNIIDGVQAILRNNHEIKLNIVEGKNIDLFQHPVFAHARIGINAKPETKVDEFKNFLMSGLGNVTDIAFMKFCFVDVTAETDVQKLLQAYIAMVTEIEKKFPHLILIHCTVPLKTSETTWKTRLKSLLGKEAWEYADNVKRNEFNELLISKYQGKEPVFDVARYEATADDGTKIEFSYRGKKYLAMNPDYFSDGGHLNSMGKKVIAEKLMLLLAGLEH